MRIVMASQTYRPATNGAAVFTIHLAEGLARAGHEVTVLQPSDRLHAYESWQGGVRVRRVRALPLAPFFSDVYVTPVTGRGAGRLLDELQPGLVHIQDHYPLSRAVASAARRRGLPLVASNLFLPENLLPPGRRLAGLRAPLERLLWWSVLGAIGQADAVTTCSETAAAILRGRGLRPPVHAISSGVDLQRFRPDASCDRADTRRRYGLDPGRALLLYVGRLDPEKRVDVLLRALQRLGRRELQLAVVGRGRQAPALQALAASLGLGQNVVFTGYVPLADLPALLASADVFAMPSEAELQCIAALEAMAAGLPLLAADARALPELVESGRNGYLFRAGDVGDCARRLAQLLEERSLWPAMGAESRAMVRRHSLGETLRRYEELYRWVSRADDVPGLGEEASVAENEGIGHR